MSKTHCDKCGQPCDDHHYCPEVQPPLEAPTLGFSRDATAGKVEMTPLKPTPDAIAREAAERIAFGEYGNHPGFLAARALFINRVLVHIQHALTRATADLLAENARLKHDLDQTEQAIGLNAEVLLQSDALRIENGQLRADNQRLTEERDKLTELENECQECGGEGRVKTDTGWMCCPECKGTRLLPTQFGEQILTLIRHNPEFFSPRDYL